MTWTGPKAGQVPHWAGSFDKLEPPTGAFLMQGGENDRFFLSADGGASGPSTPSRSASTPPKVPQKGSGASSSKTTAGVLVLVGADGGRNPIPEAIYESGDDTASWRLVTAVPGTFEVQFLSPDGLGPLLETLSEIRTTSDGGAHWTDNGCFHVALRHVFPEVRDSEDRLGDRKSVSTYLERHARIATPRSSS